VDYTYDGAGNRTSAGGSIYTYDARGELTPAASPAGTTSYSYTARGTMASQSGPSGSFTLTSSRRTPAVTGRRSTRRRERDRRYRRTRKSGILS
jgi:YD repeat-containing protein